MSESGSDGEPRRPASRPRRSDALRNIDAIVAAAGRLLAEQPRASMQEVAEAAGVHRATVHRHFPSRDDLLAALRRRSLDDVQALLDDPELTAGDPGDALERLTAETLRLGDRTRTWRVMPTYDDASDARAAELAAPLRELFERGQIAGEIRTDLPVELLMSAWGGLVLSSLPLMASGRLGVEAAAGYVRRMLAGPP